MPLLDKALKASREQSEEDTPILKAEILITQGAILIQEGNYVQAQDLCTQVLDFLPENEVLLHTEAHLRKGICACMLSKPRDGIVELQLALALCGHETMTRQSARLLDMPLTIMQQYTPAVRQNFLSDVIDLPGTVEQFHRVIVRKVFHCSLLPTSAGTDLSCPRLACRVVPRTR